MNDNGLLGSADHTVIESFRVNYGVYGKNDIRGIVDDRGSVARADAESRFAGRISGFNHSGAARRENYVRFFHEEVGHFERRKVNPVDDSFGRAGFNGENDLSRGDGRFFRSRVRTDDDRVSRFEGDHGFENRGGSGVGRRNDRGDNAYGFGDFLYSVSLILFDNAAGFSVLISVINIFGRVVVFDDFIFNHAHAGFFHCHFRERNTRLVGGDCGGFENLVYLFLRIGREFTLSVLYSCDSRFERFDAVDYLSFFVFHRNLLYFVLFFYLILFCRWASESARSSY